MAACSYDSVLFLMEVCVVAGEAGRDAAEVTAFLAPETAGLGDTGSLKKRSKGGSESGEKRRKKMKS